MRATPMTDTIPGPLALGLEVFRCGGTGVVVVLCNGEVPVVGLRANTDGLPVRQDTGLDCASASSKGWPEP